MLARCGAAGCILVLLATLLFALIAFGRGTAGTVLIAGSYILLGFAAVVFIAAEVVQVIRRSRLVGHERRAPRRGLAHASAAGPQNPQPIQAAEDLVRLLDNTLKLAEPMPSVAQLEPVNVAEILGELTRKQETTRLSSSGRTGAVHALASRPALKRALEILVENALANGQRASVSCDRGTSAVVVHVDDNGPGVAKESRLRVFDWNYYMSTAPSEQVGCRPELVIARQIMRVHGGTLAVGPSPLGGARFSAQLPLLGEHEMELAAAS